jgi:hypothetical protein
MTRGHAFVISAILCHRFSAYSLFKRDLGHGRSHYTR